MFHNNLCFINIYNYNLNWFIVYFYISNNIYYNLSTWMLFIHNNQVFFKTKNFVIFISDTIQCSSINVPIYYAASSVSNSVSGITAAFWTNVFSISDFGWYCECSPFHRNQITVATWAQLPTVHVSALYQPTSGSCWTFRLIFNQRKYVLDDVCLDWIFPHVFIGGLVDLYVQVLQMLVGIIGSLWELIHSKCDWPKIVST